MARLLDFHGRSGFARAVEAEGERPTQMASATASSTGGARRERASRIEQDALGKIGESKVESFGCAQCGGQEIIGWGLSRGLPRYRCKSCGRTFNAATNTPLSRLRKRGAWLDQAQAMIEGVSLAKAAERCGVHASTAYRWRDRFLSAPALDKLQILRGIVEADETFMLESFKGRRSGLTREPHSQGGKARHSGTGPNWRIVRDSKPDTTPCLDRSQRRMRAEPCAAIGESRTPCIGNSTSISPRTDRAYAKGTARPIWPSSNTSPSTSSKPPANPRVPRQPTQNPRPTSLHRNRKIATRDTNYLTHFHVANDR